MVASIPYRGEIPMPHPNPEEWYPLILLSVFSVTDVAGRFCVPFYDFGPYIGKLTPNNVWIPTVSRFLGIPFVIAMVNNNATVVNGTSASYLDYLSFMRHDALAMVVVGLFGFTNGYLGSLNIVFVNQRVKEEVEEVK
ncbi:Epsin-1, required for endocytosis and actin patch assembly, partial [Quaeritorhiza haematococci]